LARKYGAGQRRPCELLTGPRVAKASSVSQQERDFGVYFLDFFCFFFVLRQKRRPFRGSGKQKPFRGSGKTTNKNHF
jgi:hypothetical protein